MLTQGQPQSQEVVEPGFHILHTQSEAVSQAFPFCGPCEGICAAERQQWCLEEGHPGGMGQLQHQSGRVEALCWTS